MLSTFDALSVRALGESYVSKYYTIEALAQTYLRVYLKKPIFTGLGGYNAPNNNVPE